jgi:hypothetical protein
MHPTRLSLLAAATACLLLAACGKDTAKGASGVAGEEGLPKPDPVSGSVTGMPNPGQSTPQPGQQVDAAPADDLETPATIVPIDGEMPTDVEGIPQGGTPELPEPGTFETPPPDPAVPASGSDTGNPETVPR